jgi:hypothetical protein
MQELTYHQEGDILYPDLAPEKLPSRPIRKFGELRRLYLRDYRPALYLELLADEALLEHLADVEEQAQVLLDTVMEQMLKGDPGPDKKSDQMGWVGHHNNIQARAEESVLKEIVYS